MAAICVTNIHKAVAGHTTSISASFSRAAQWTSQQCGRPATFIAACFVIVVWAVTGPVFNYSDTWQLIINTGTTIITFLMVFLIQNTQNRDMSALHLKLDELIRANETARNKLLTLEDMSEAELEGIKNSFTRIAAKAPEKPLLREVAEDLEVASEEIEDATDKVNESRKNRRWNFGAHTSLARDNSPSRSAERTRCTIT
jgi:low affinity Fe/Cu permease